MLIAPATGAGQAVVESVRLVADLDVGDAAAAVRVVYELAGLRPEDGSVPVRGLLFHGTALERVEAEGTTVTLDAASPRAPVARITVRPGRDGRATLDLRYRVAGAVAINGVEARVRIPVLAPGLPPADGTPGFFEGSVRGPAAWRVSEGFPSTVRRGEVPGAWAVDLPVVPAMVSLRARTDGTWRPGLAGLLDAVALAALVAFFVAAGRQMRREG